MAEKTFYDEFIEIYSNNIKRKGADKLLKWLMSTDFFIAPASTKHHFAEPEGLLKHSLYTYRRLKEECAHTDFAELRANAPSDETIAIVGLLHDLCNVNVFKVGKKNQKQADGTWKEVPFYTIEDELPYGHGEKSVMIINGFMKLTRDEMFAIRWHMGGFDDAVKGGSFCLNKTYKICPLALLAHIADQKATWFDE